MWMSNSLEQDKFRCVSIIGPKNIEHQPSFSIQIGPNKTQTNATWTVDVSGIGMTKSELADKVAINVV